MNYIKHLNAVMFHFYDDDRLNPRHISLYLALFQFWNLSRFSNSLSICRNETMQLSKIYSKTTYHKCLKDLDKWKYIIYKPSHNPFKGSIVQMIEFELNQSLEDEKTVPKNGQALVRGVSKNGQVLVQSVPKNGQALVPSINNINYKHNKLVNGARARPNIDTVLFFFKKENIEKNEAEKFFNYYESQGWMVGNNPMVNWEAAAKKWIIKFKESEHKEFKQNEAHGQYRDNLNASTNKRYDDPL